MFNNIYNIKTMKQFGNEPLSVAIKVKFCVVKTDMV